MLDQIMKKKDGKEMDPAKKQAKLAAVSEMRDLAASLMKEGLGKHLEGIKKVSVAAPDSASLKEGLDKAKDMLGEGSEEGSEDEMPGSEDSDEDSSEEADESPAEEAHEEEDELKDMDLSMEEIEEMQRILEEKKSKLLG